MKLQRGVLAIAAIAALAVSAPAQDAEKLVKGSDCFSCHAVDHKVVGDSFVSIAKKYAGQSDGAGKIAAKIRDGGGGMTPHPKFSDAERQEIANWVLAQTASSPAGRSQAKSYSYKLSDGTTTSIDFPIFLEGQGGKVTKEVFHGYQFFNSYCYRCHGTDATGGQLAPDLRHSVSVGMGQQGFLSVAMSGKDDKGMPSWAGFLTEEDVVDIYKYVKGRSLDLISVGRPASAQD